MPAGAGPIPARRYPKRTVRPGLCPIGEFVFSPSDARRQKGRVRAIRRRCGMEFCDLDGVLPDGMVRDQKHVALVMRYFREERIDALFIPHSNFGTEGAAGLIAEGCGVPVLFGGPPEADGSRLWDSLCVTQATSKVLYSMRVPFTQDFCAWMEVDNWTRWERRLVCGPCIHRGSFV